MYEIVSEELGAIFEYYSVWFNNFLFVVIIVYWLLYLYLQMPRVGRFRTLISKACGVLFSVAGGMYVYMYVCTII